MSTIPPDHTFTFTRDEFVETCVEYHLSPRVAYGPSGFPHFHVLVPGISPERAFARDEELDPAAWFDAVTSIKTDTGEARLKVVGDDRERKRVGVRYTEAGRKQAAFDRRYFGVRSAREEQRALRAKIRRATGTRKRITRAYVTSSLSNEES